MTTRVHQSFLNNTAFAMYSGRTVAEEEFRQEMTDILGRTPERFKRKNQGPPWTIRFAAEKPMWAQFNAGGLLLSLRGASFKSGKSRAQEILLSASMDNGSLTKPLGGISYTKLGVSTIGQALRAETFFGSKFKNANEIVIWLHGLANDLDFYPDDSERFEKAIALLGSAIGFETQRPEADRPIFAAARPL